MKAATQHKESHSVEVKKEKQNESEDTSINEILSKYSVWFMKNNMEDFQMLCKFWNQQFAANYKSI